MSSDRSAPPTSLEQARISDPPSRRVGIGTIVALSLAVGLVAAVLLPFAPWPTVDADSATAGVLFGFALGWALLAALSVALTDQPQRWAVVPAVFMAVSGVVLLMLPDGLLAVLDWIWPPAVLVLVVFVFRRAKGDLRSRTRTWLLNPVLAVLVLLALGGAYEAIGRATEPAVAMRGELVDVGPYRLHLECTGTGAPTVILEPGGGASAATLGWIAPDVARHTTVCVYDRAGKGWSDAAQTAPDGARIATDLHTLLERAHVAGPFVLAGHSFGGLYVMRYAAQYPDQVAGMVLIDSTAPNAAPVPATAEGSDSLLKHVSALLSTTARLGLGRLIAGAIPSDLPPSYRDEANASAATAKEMASFIDEYAVAGRSASEAGALATLGGKPLVVLTAEQGNAPGWMAHQDAMASLSTDSRHHVVPGSTHQSLTDDPAHAAVVSGAIVDLVEAVRTGLPLASH
jgi:pimeloyl-ACP methyl ester carboxylesterase